MISTNNEDNSNFCSHCGRPYHNANECWHNPKSPKYRRNLRNEGRHLDNKNGGGKNGGHGNDKKGGGAGKPVAFITKTLTSDQKSERKQNESTWVIDCACTAHMTNELSIITDYIYKPSQIQVGNKAYMRSEGYGNVHATVDVWGKKKHITLKNVLHVPGILHNLISVSQCRRNGCSSVIEDLNEGPKGVMRIIHKESGDDVLIGPETSEGLYKTTISVISKNLTENKCNVSSSVKSDYELWHKRLGHISPTTMAKSIKIVRGINIKSNPKTEADFCEPCALGKSNRKPRSDLTDDSTVTTKPLERVYSDLVGPTRYPSLADSRYFITLLDDYSGFSMVRFLKRKGDAPVAIKSMMGEIEQLFQSKIGSLNTLTNRKIRALRTDGGGEYISKSFQKYLDEKGIKHETTTAYSPESNGAAERLNRTLLDMARTMLLNIANNQMHRFWAEAINTANYIRNRAYTKSCKEDKTPFETVNGNTPNLSHLRIFGCDAYVHTPKQRRKNKFDDRAKRGFLIGYDKGKAYRVFMLDKKEIIISKDVDFNETENLNDMETIKPIEFNGFEIDDLFDIDNLCESENTKNSTQNQDPVQDSNANAPSNAIDNNTDHDSDNDELLYVPNIRRSARATAGEPPERFHENHIALMMQSTGPVQSKSIPKNFKSAVTGKDMRHWIEAMNQEFDTLTKMNTWKLVKLPKDRKAIRVKWVYDIKTNSDGEIERYRARLVAMGFFQREGVDFFEVFAPVVKYVTVRIFFCVTARHKWNRRTIDVRCAFINAFLNEEIYIMQPEGFVDPGYEDYVY